MRYAILADIHANYEGLQAVLEDAREQGATHYACLGDVVGYNADPGECLEVIRQLRCPVVRGNHDHYCSHSDSLEGFHPLAANVIDWTRTRLSSEQREYLGNLALVDSVESFTIVHSTLDTPEEWGYVFDKLEAEANFSYQTTSLCFYGHTHVPMVFEKSDSIRAGTYRQLKLEVGRKYLINVGSVGQPRDGDPRAAYVMYDLDKGTIELRRVPYDFRETQRKILDHGLPHRLAFRLAQGR
jgi:predicted phosphodiesterase